MYTKIEVNCRCTWSNCVIWQRCQAVKPCTTRMGWALLSAPVCSCAAPKREHGPKGWHAPLAYLCFLLEAIALSANSFRKCGPRAHCTSARGACHHLGPCWCLGAAQQLSQAQYTMIPYHLCTALHPGVHAPMCWTPWPKCLSALYHHGTIKNTAPALCPTPMLPWHTNVFSKRQ